MLNDKMYSVIDFGTSKISIAMGKKKKNKIQYSGIGICEYAGFRDALWLAPNDIDESIYLAKRDLEQQTRRRVRDVYVNVPGEFTRTFFAHVSCRPINLDGRIVKDDVQKLIDDGMANLPWPQDYKIMHKNPIVYILDGITKRQSPVGQYARDFEAFISYTAIDEYFMHDIKILLDELGLGAIDFFAASNVIGEAIEINMQKKTVVVIDSGYYSSDIILYENNGLIAHENVPLGGYHIYSDIMNSLNKDPDIAELIKRNCSIGMESLGLNKILLDERNEKVSFAVDATQNIIEARVHELMEVVAQEIEKTGLKLDSRCGIYLTGGGIAKIQGVREICSKILNQTVRIYKPLEPIQVNETHTAVCSGLEYIIRHNGRVNGFDSHSSGGINYTGLFR